MKQYLVIETFLPGCKQKIYERFHTQGRMLPDEVLTDTGIRVARKMMATKREENDCF